MGAGGTRCARSAIAARRRGAAAAESSEHVLLKVEPALLRRQVVKCLLCGLGVWGGCWGAGLMKTAEGGHE